MSGQVYPELGPLGRMGRWLEHDKKQGWGDRSKDFGPSWR